MTKLRERFEAWHKREHGWIPEWDDAVNRYVTDVEHSRYVAYQAALEPVRELVKQWQTGDGFNGEDWYGLSKCRDELANLLEE